MHRLVLDIETSGTPFDELDADTQEYLLKRADTPEKITQVKEQLNTFPLTGEIVAIGVLDVDALTGAVYFQAPGRKVDAFVEEGIRYEPGTERECLERFWRVAGASDQIITFNGRGFDAPWLMIRSIVHGIPVTKNLMPNRFSTEHHLDLADQLTFYGATRGYSLDFWCKTLGIASPKTDMIGKDVPQHFRAGEYERIARYNGRDLRATRELFVRWQAAMRR
ncbi:ribonuclease H-like domain-containing protein [Candidatus Uhrbacteria bacterium]|nr:ribonuclease H-like domain-containing protein [Candidatus Uhrbacteria bacterium]